MIELSLGRGRHQTVFLSARDDRLGQQVLARPLQPCRQTQHSSPSSPPGAATTTSSTDLPVAFAIGAIGLLCVTGMDHDQASGPITLVAVALLYSVFAFENGDATDTAVHTVIVALFAALAILGYKRGLALVGAGMIAHGLFDGAIGLVAGNLAPDW